MGYTLVIVFILYFSRQIRPVEKLIQNRAGNELFANYTSYIKIETSIFLI